MLTRRALSTLFAAGAASVASVAIAGSTASRRSEVEALRRFCEATHPEGPRAALSADWRARAASLAAKADAMDASRYAVEVMRLLGWFGDGHTAMIIYAYDKGAYGPRLPVKADVFDDGLYVTAAKDEGLSLMGARVTRLAGAPIETVVRRFAEAWPKTNMAWPHRWTPLLLRTPGLLHGLGFLVGPDDAPVVVEGVHDDGRAVSARLAPRAGAQTGRTALTRSLSALDTFAATQSFGAQPNPTEDGRNFVWRLSARRALYVSLDRMDDDDFGKPWARFEQEVFASLQRPVEQRLIIDLRRNGGGDNTLPEPLRHAVGRSAYNRPGGLYVLISPHTFSAAQNLATRLERETFARFVGEPSGLSPNHFGDGAPFKAEVSGLPIYVSTVRWQDVPPLDHRPWIMPDLLVPSRFADWRAGHDAALEAALADESVRDQDDHTLSAPWERPSQRQAWNPFWMKGAPPTVTPVRSR